VESWKEKLGFFDYTRLLVYYKHPVVEASSIPHCRKAIEALGVTLILDVFLLS
jgi:hypothetical protein